MAKSSFLVFHISDTTPVAPTAPPDNLKFIWWQPRWNRIFPPHHTTKRVLAFWLMHLLGIFRNNKYAVFVVEDERGEFVHSTFCIPAWFEFPFMHANDVHLGVLTSLNSRRHGIALYGLRYCIERLVEPGRQIYYVAQMDNVPSHKLAVKAGLQFFAIARKSTMWSLGYYSLLSIGSDYSLAQEESAPYYSAKEFADLVNQSGHLKYSAAADRKFRVLAVIPTSEGQASMIFAWRQMKAMAAKGHTIEVFELSDRRNPWLLPRAFGSYRKRLRAFQPDLVHVHYGAMTGFFGALGAIGLAPVVVTFRGSDLNPVPSSSLWKVLPSHVLSQFASLLGRSSICVSEELRNRLWFGKSKAIVVPTGVDTTRFFPGSRDAARRELGWDLDLPVVLFNAGYSPMVKRLDLAQDVIALVQRSFPLLKFVVLHGDIVPDEVPELMRASDCLLFTSDFEGSPTVIQEAMACDLPIVSVPVGDVPQRIADVVACRLVPRDPAQLAHAVIEVLRERRRSDTNSIAVAELGNEAITRSIEKVYGHVASSD